MATKWMDLKHKAPPEKRERLKQEALSELDALERSGMAVLRTARHQTQVALAEQMNIPQSAVSRMERQRDLRLSTLQRYVTALGGRLEMRAVFPDDVIELDSLVDRNAAERKAS